MFIPVPTALDENQDSDICLMEGWRKFVPIDDGLGPVEQGDVLVFQRRHGSGVVLLRVTDVWTSDGIAPGWRLASVERVALVVRQP